MASFFHLLAMSEHTNKRDLNITYGIFVAQNSLIPPDFKMESVWPLYFALMEISIVGFVFVKHSAILSPPTIDS